MSLKSINQNELKIGTKWGNNRQRRVLPVECSENNCCLKLNRLWFALYWRLLHRSPIVLQCQFDIVLRNTTGTQQIYYLFVGSPSIAPFLRRLRFILVKLLLGLILLLNAFYLSFRISRCLYALTAFIRFFFE